VAVFMQWLNILCKLFSPTMPTNLFQTLIQAHFLSFFRQMYLIPLKQSGQLRPQSSVGCLS